MSKERMLVAQQLIKEKKYQEARVILKTVNHPTAKKWISQIDRISATSSNSRPKNKRSTSNTKRSQPKGLSASTTIDASSQILYNASPSILRGHPILSMVLICSCLGIFLFIPWWLSNKKTRLIITTETITLNHGLISKSISEIHLVDVRNVKIAQSGMQRLLGTGLIEISTAGSSGDDIIVQGLPNPHKIRDIINRARRRAT